MPRYKVTGPDGNSYFVTAPDGATEQQVMAYARKMAPKAASPSKKDTLARSFTQGGLAGFLDEAGAVADTLGLTPGRESVWKSGNFRDTYVKNRDMNREILDEDKRTNPKTAMGGEIAGAVTSMMVAPGAGAKGVKALIPDAAYGAAYGIGDSRKQSVGGVAKDAAKSAALGVAGGLAGRGIAKAGGRILAPKVNPAVRKLADEGVTMTPGQIRGGTLKAVEDKLASVPILGDSINAARRRGVDQFNRAAVNRALRPINKALPKGVKGADAMRFLQTAYNDAYDAARAGMQFQADDAFRASLDDLVARADAGELSEQSAKRLRTIIDNHILRRASDGYANGDTYKVMVSGIKKIASKTDDRELQSALRELVGNIDDAAKRVSDPRAVALMEKADEGYSMLYRVEDAAKRRGGEVGMFTPNQLDAAVQKADRTTNNRAFLRGDALMQDLSSAGREVLPSSVPNSGTADRLLLPAAMGGYIEPTTMLMTAPLTVPYAPVVDRGLQNLMINRPELLIRAGQRAPQVATPLGMFGAGLAVTQGK